MDINSLHSKQTGNILSPGRVGIYFLAFLDLFLLFGILIGRNNFFHSVFISLSLVTSVAALFTIIIGRFSSGRKALRENIYIITSAIFEMFLLFGLPLHMLFTPTLLGMQPFIVVVVQFLATIFFWMAFKSELMPRFTFSSNNYKSGIIKTYGYKMHTR